MRRLNEHLKILQVRFIQVHQMNKMNLLRLSEIFGLKFASSEKKEIVQIYVTEKTVAVC